MYTPEIAVQLRRRGHDVVAAREQGGLAVAPDDTLLAVAQSEDRVVVTENVPDFLRLDVQYREQGQHHVGMILTTNRGYSRHDAGGIGRLVVALDAWLREHSEEATPDSTIWWL